MKYSKTLLLLLVVYCVNNIKAEIEQVTEESGIDKIRESVVSDGKGDQTGVEETLNGGGSGQIGGGSGQIGESVKSGADGMSKPSLPTTEGLVPSGGNNNEGSKSENKKKKRLEALIETGKKIIKPVVEIIGQIGQTAINFIGGKKDSKTTPDKPISPVA